MHSQIMFLFGGMALFMFGLNIASEYLQKIAANKVRELLASLSNRPVLAMVVGIALTILLQSSGAVTSMLVGLGGANVITLQRVMGVIVGTAIGTTFTVQLISFNIVQYGLTIFFLAFFVHFVTKGRVLKNISGVFIGFGLVFWGLEMMSYGTLVLKTNKELIELFTQMNDTPLLATCVTALFTASIQSSAVVIGLAMSLAGANVITLENAMYWVYGANIGTTATGLIAAMGGNYISRQIAWAHVLFKVGGVIVFYFLTVPFTKLVGFLGGDVMRDIANAHTLFNVISALAFYPFINAGANLVQKLFPKGEGDREFGPEYITDKFYNNPALAFERARRETLRLGDIVLGMIGDSIDLFKGDNPELQESIKKRDNQVDLLHREIKLYMVRYTTDGTPNAARTFQLISFVGDLEGVGDVVEKALLDLARKKQALKLEFSPEGWEELCFFHREVVEFASLALSSFHMQDVELAQKVIDKKRIIRDLEQKLKECHLERLNKGASVTINTSSIHLEVLQDYRRVVGLMANHAYALINKNDNAKNKLES